MKQLFNSSYLLSFLLTVVLFGVRILNESFLELARIKPEVSVRTPSKDLFTKLNWLNFGYRFKYHTAVLMYKCLNNLTPKYITDVISFSNNFTYNLRSASRHDITNSRYKTSYKKKAFSYATTEVWNKIPTFIREAKTLHTFF